VNLGVESTAILSKCSAVRNPAKGPGIVGKREKNPAVNCGAKYLDERIYEENTGGRGKSTQERKYAHIGQKNS